MRPGGKVLVVWHALLSSLLWTTGLAADEPIVKANKFDHAPLNLNYFEDSDIVLFQDFTSKNVYRSTDAGASWAKVDDIPAGKAGKLIMHPVDKKRAYVVTDSKTQYKTVNQGKSWDSFESKVFPTKFKQDIIMNFHAADADRIIFNAMDCDPLCAEVAMYTTDNFDHIEPLRAETEGCWWAKSAAPFTTGDAEKDKSRILCIVREDYSFWREEQRLAISDNFFAVKGGKIDEYEPKINKNKAVRGLIVLAVKNKHLLIATATPGSDEMSLFVTDNSDTWHRAMFPESTGHGHSHRLNQGSYTVLEGTNYSIQIDVMSARPSQPMGILFTSNSNGTYFTENIEYTNRNEAGIVDFEKMTGIQGVYLVNTVKNGKKVAAGEARKELVTEITFDDGRTFESIKTGDHDLHLHSVTRPDNVGRVFSSPAPGLVMGNGNTGKKLGKFYESDLYVSDDGGMTWKKALDGPHKYEFGDSGSVLIAIKDTKKKEEDVKEFSYSLDHGENWKSMKLPDDLSIRPELLTTTQDSTSLKFLLIGSKDGAYHVVAIDFEGLHERTCEDKDMEDWHARADKDGKPTCIMGHKQTYRRRKKTADCFIKKEFEDPVPKTEDCECTDADFECDYNFQRDREDRTKCTKVGPVASPEDTCKKNPDGVFKGSSGWRLIPGNTCKRPDGEQKDDKKEYKCSEGDSGSSPPPATGEVSATRKEFDFKFKGFDKTYLERGEASSSTDETIIMRGASEPIDGLYTPDEDLWITHDQGKNWTRILKGEKIRDIIPHPYFRDVVFFTTAESKRLIYTIDRGHSFHPFKVKVPARKGVLPLEFHQDNKDWLLWMGNSCEEIGGEESCFPEVFYSLDRGDSWDSALRYAVRCEFLGNSALQPPREENRLLCLAHKDENLMSNFTVAASDDFFKKDKLVHELTVENFRTMSEFVAMKTKDTETGASHAYVSLDGRQFSEAKYPLNFHASKFAEYTLLDSSTHAVNLLVTSAEQATKERNFGSIIKSNSNGTSYVLSAADVNANQGNLADYEHVVGLEGVALINTVANPDKKDEKKVLHTKITHNDGSRWSFLAPPSKDSEDKSYSCSSSKGDASCALHLHHYTEREDKDRTFARDTAVGVMFGAGNVGPSLGDIKEADTFMTTDAGITWKSVKKGYWTWQYGDQGSIIVLVQRATKKNSVKTKIVTYSTDEGKTWQDYEFTDSEVTVLDITTLRTGISRNFVLWCKAGDGGSAKMMTVNLDFTGLTDEACKLIEDSEESDYDLFTPQHPLQDNGCLFGHKASYLRKKTNRKCYNEENLQRIQKYENCECTREDFECAYNYQMDPSNQCSLVEGLEPKSGEEWCKQHPNETSWFEPTGYRRIPLSTCKGGRELDKTSEEHACPEHEEEFERLHRTSGVAIFFAIVIPFALASTIGWWVYRNWDGKFGQIRLGENSATFDSNQPWIKYPVMAVSGVVAVAATLPLLAAGLWRSATGSYQRLGGGGGGGGAGRSWLSRGPRRFTTRDSFARGRGDYAVVDDVEGELLGDESDDDV